VKAQVHIAHQEVCVRRHRDVIMEQSIGIICVRFTLWNDLKKTPENSLHGTYFRRRLQGKQMLQLHHWKYPILCYRCTKISLNTNNEKEQWYLVSKAQAAIHATSISNQLSVMALINIQ